MKTIVYLVLLATIFFATPSYSLTIGGTQVANISSYLSDLKAFEDSTANITSGANVSWAYGYDNSTFNIMSGANVSWAYGYDNSTFNINGGDISWVKLYENNTTNINFADSMSWLLLSDNATVNIYGNNFDYSAGHLSGIWGNGLTFSFWALNESDLSSGNLSGPMPDNIILHPAPVPEPTAIMLFVTGILIMAFIKRKSNKSLNLTARPPA